MMLLFLNCTFRVLVHVLALKECERGRDGGRWFMTVSPCFFFSFTRVPRFFIVCIRRPLFPFLLVIAFSAHFFAFARL